MSGVCLLDPESYAHILARVQNVLLVDERPSGIDCLSLFCERGKRGARLPRLG